MDDETELDFKPMTIRAMPVAERMLAVACAEKAGLSMAEWMARAVRSQARIDEEDAVVVPDPAVQPIDVDCKTVVVRSVDLSELNQFLIAASGFVSNPRIGRRAVAAISALAVDKVHEIRGLPLRSRASDPAKQPDLLSIAGR